MMETVSRITKRKRISHKLPHKSRYCHLGKWCRRSLMPSTTEWTLEDTENETGDGKCSSSLISSLSSTTSSSFSFFLLLMSLGIGWVLNVMCGGGSKKLRPPSSSCRGGSCCCSGCDGGEGCCCISALPKLRIPRRLLLDRRNRSRHHPILCGAALEGTM